MHPDGNKLYRDLRELYWWPGLKREVTDYIRILGSHLGSGRNYMRLWVHDWISVSFFTLRRMDNLRECCTPTCWTELGERRILGLELIADTEDKVKLIRGRLKEAFDRQKSYADLKCKEIKYSVGDYAFLKLELPPELGRIHDVFHVSMLRRYRSDPSHVVSVKEIEARPDLTFEEEPV
ncbi:uncharacterized protein LOC108451653 [Gossypium arboreum]|uniref:uncharacterized protein LOC108451653 n=1 Tax=Gossypium arboreum TaxID=29729 RepID=UPI0022F176BF|nr:uncharacterized protein LOC108451653 [Gossypium arboreum]